MILPIVKEPHDILRHKADRVEKVTPEIRRLAADMIETMYAAEGVGLAANQIGSPLHLFVANPIDKRGEELVLLNAVITNRSGEHQSPEGCLSLPGVSAPVTRAAEVTVTGMELNGGTVMLKAKGFLAKIFQHEIDHLEGRLYPDRLPSAEGKRLFEKYRKLAETLRRVDL